MSHRPPVAAIGFPSSIPPGWAALRVGYAALRLLAVVSVAGCGATPAPDGAKTDGPSAAPAPAAPEAQAPAPPGPGHAGAAGPPGAAAGRAGYAARERAAIRAVVEARADALGAGRPLVYARTTAGRRRSRDAADARRARQLGLRGVRVTRVAVGVRRHRAVARVRFSYSIDRVAGRWTYAQVLRLRRTRLGWRVTAVHPRVPRPPWELATHRRMNTRHFTVFAPRGLRTGGTDLGTTLERAHATIRRRLPGRSGRRYPVFLVADAPDMAAMTRGIRAVDRLSAITDLSVRMVGPAQRVTAVPGARILIPWPSFVRLDPAARERVLTHELAHAVLAPATSGRAPAWLQEGIALYVSGDRRTAAARAALPAAENPGARDSPLARLARPGAMAPLGATELSAAYALSSSAAHHIADRYGPEKLLELLAVFADESLPGRPGRSLSDRATRRVLGIGADRLERDIGAWLRAGAPALGG